MKKYKLGFKGGFERANPDGSRTCFFKHNYEYEEYLKWVEKGNTPDPADEEE